MKISAFTRAAGASLGLILAATASAAAVAQEEYEPLGVPSGTYELDPGHAYLVFSYSHMGFSRPILAFRDFDATIDFNAEDPAASTVSVTVNADSVDTGVGERFENHVRGEDFFNVEAFPEITFQSTNVERTGQDTGVVTGDLTMVGVTKPLTLNVVLRQAAEHPMRRRPVLGLGATGTLMRSEWGVDYGVGASSDEVEITIEGEFALATE